MTILFNVLFIVALFLFFANGIPTLIKMLRFDAQTLAREIEVADMLWFSGELTYLVVYFVLIKS